MKELERPIVPTELITAAKSVYAQELTTIICKQSAYITHLEMKLKNHGVSHHVSRRFDIDFNGHVLAGLSITNNEPKVVGAMNGYGHGMRASDCKITELKD